MSRRIAIPVGLVIALLCLLWVLDVDDRLWYLWHDVRVPDETKQHSVWLPDYHADVMAYKIPGLDKNVSGITFNYDTRRLWVVVNQPPSLVELDLDLNPVRRIPLEHFRDTEDVAYAGEGVFVIADERSQSVVLAAIDQHTQSLDKEQLRQLSVNVDGTGNKGLEGITVDPKRNVIYMVRERDPMRLMSLSGFLEDRHIINIETPEEIDVNRLYLNDLSALHFDPATGHLLFLSDEARLLAEIDLHGNKVSYMDLVAGFSGLKRSIPQAEGVTLDNRGNLYIVSEPNLLYRFVRKVGGHRRG